MNTLNMDNTLFIGDLHFGHKNILAYDNRPFNTIEEHDEALIKNWNGKVGDEDHVYILGDFSFYNTNKSCEILDQLKGHKHLIVGNHDNRNYKSEKFRSYFESIDEYKKLYLELKPGEKPIRIILCHYPIASYENMFRNKYYHLYAHVHRSYDYNMILTIQRQFKELYGKAPKSYNVGAMMPYMKYTPKRLDEIIALHYFMSDMLPCNKPTVKKGEEYHG